jgi:16S rRNA (guanine527-N7)-methyltransferase
MRPDEEIAALPAGWTLSALHALTVPGLVGERHLVIVARTDDLPSP